jgi:hypothetical protein
MHGKTQARSALLLAVNGIEKPFSKLAQLGRSRLRFLLQADVVVSQSGNLAFKGCAIPLFLQTERKGCNGNQIMHNH